ncbi:hypothetical protein [Longimycelium tulufanense]|uniref:hypothetical protein n=1 Tax=Longimycelium tulufanense TaxID=907463 RepID=UPI00166C098A|nr:hypothetical protein [Longimycelium tulufanense]
MARLYVRVRPDRAADPMFRARSGLADDVRSVHLVDVDLTQPTPEWLLPLCAHKRRHRVQLRADDVERLDELGGMPCAACLFAAAQNTADEHPQGASRRPLVSPDRVEALTTRGFYVAPHLNSLGQFAGWVYAHFEDHGTRYAATTVEIDTTGQGRAGHWDLRYDPRAPLTHPDPIDSRVGPADAVIDWALGPMPPAWPPSPQ